MSKEFTLQDVAEHNTKQDLYCVIHNKVYDMTKFVDEHPGGEEVLLDVGGQDATDAFEDVGHSDEARETLAQLLVGSLKGQPAAPSTGARPSGGSLAPKAQTDSAGMGIGVYAILVVGGLLSYAVYLYLQQQLEEPTPA